MQSLCAIGVFFSGAPNDSDKQFETIFQRPHCTQDFLAHAHAELVLHISFE